MDDNKKMIKALISFMSDMLSNQKLQQCTDFGQTKDIVDEKQFCNEPLVSVLVITYNHEKYIRECLASILSQETDFDFEIIIAEDCSQDSTLEICKEYQSRYPNCIRIITGTINIGFEQNMVRALKYLRGKYIAQCEGDDFWCTSMKLQMQVNVLKSISKVSLVYTNCYRQHEFSKLGRFPLSKRRCATLLAYNKMEHEVFANFVLTDNCIPTASVIFRHDDLPYLIERINELQHIVHRIPSMDFVLNFLLAQRGRIIFLPVPTVVRRINGGSLTASTVWKHVANRILGDCRTRLGLLLSLDKPVPQPVIEKIFKQVAVYTVEWCCVHRTMPQNGIRVFLNTREMDFSIAEKLFVDGYPMLLQTILLLRCIKFHLSRMSFSFYVHRIGLSLVEQYEHFLVICKLDCI